MNDAGYMISHDAHSAQILAKTMSFVSSTGTGMMMLLIALFIIWRFINVWISEGFSIKWFVTVILGLFIFNFLVGLPFGISGSAMQPMTTVVTTNQAGEKSEPVDIDGGLAGATPEVLAAQLGGDGSETLARANGDNLAGVGMFNEGTVTVYKAPMSSFTGAKDDSDDNAPKYSSFLSSWSNMWNSVGSVFAHNEEKKIVKAELEASGEAPEQMHEAQGSLVSELFAADVAGGAPNTQTTVVAALPTNYPGGAQGYFKYWSRRMFDPSLTYASQVADGNELQNSINEGREPSPVGSARSNSFAQLAAQNGFDAQGNGVKPEYFLRTHTDLFQKTCGNNLGGLRAEAAKAETETDSGQSPTSSSAVSGASLIAALNPCQISVDRPMVAADVQAAGGRGGAPGDLRSLLPPKLGAAFGEALGPLASMSGSKNLASLINLQLPTTKQAACTAPTSLAGVIDQYQRQLSSSTDQDAANRKCLEMGLKLAQVSMAVAQNADKNQSAYNDFLTSSSSVAIESSSVMAVSTGESGSDVLAGAFDFERSGAIASNAANFKSDYSNSPFAGLFGGLKSGGSDFGGTGKLIAKTQVPGTYKDTASSLASKRAIVAEQNFHQQHVEARKKMNIFERAADHVSEATESLITWLKDALMLLLKVLMVLICLPLMLAVITAFVMLKYTVAAATGLSAGLLPMWATIALNRVFHGTSDDGSHESGIAVFPIMTLAGAPIVNGALTSMVAISEGAVTDFIRNAMVYIPQMFEAGLATAGQALFNMGGDPIALMTGAMKPLGIIAASSVPVLMIGKLLSGQIFAHMAGATAGTVATAGSAAVGGAMVGAAGKAISVADNMGSKGGSKGDGGGKDGSKVPDDHKNELPKKK